MIHYLEETIWILICMLLSQLEADEDVSTLSGMNYFTVVANNSISFTYKLLEGNSKAYSFLCPKSFFIATLHYKFRFKTADLYDKFGLDPAGHIFSIQNKLESNPTFYQSSLKNPCSSLNYCVGYQACLFKFSNEFCCFDATLNRGNVIIVTITCDQDDTLNKYLNKLNLHEPLYNQIVTNIDEIIHLTHTTFIDLGIRDYESVTILPKISNETNIFHANCPDLSEVYHRGYRGICLSKSRKQVEIVNDLWSVLARANEGCQEELLNTYCSFLYNSSGGCIPPHLLEKEALGDSIQFNFQVFPRKGFRPDLTLYEKVLAEPHQNLIPARLGFMILAYSQPSIVLQLLELIYRPHHYFIIHIDKRYPAVRKELKTLLKNASLDKSNVFVLPEERSFLSAWASYGLIRATLECLEELLRLGVWDFALNLSAADLPLRDIDDLAAALAPYRGQSFNMPLYQRNVSQDNQVWHGCGGFTFNVKDGKDRSLGQEIFNISALWNIFSRNFSEFLVSGESKQGKEYFQYYLMTHLDGDELYFSAWLALPPYRDKFIPRNTIMAQTVVKKTIDGICRRLDQADFCGQGPGIFTSKEEKDLLFGANIYFFARKFQLDLDDTGRKAALEIFKSKYKSYIKDHISEEVLRQVAGILVNYPNGNYFDDLSQSVSITGWRLFPRFLPSNICCYNALTENLHGIQEFQYWIDFVMLINFTETSYRLAITPRTPTRCFSKGDLQMIFITTRKENQNIRLVAQVYYPNPGMPPGKQIFISLFFNIKEIGFQCQDTESLDVQKSFAKFIINGDIPNILQMSLHINIVSPDKEVFCSSSIFVMWSTEMIDSQGGKNKTSYLHSFTMDCNVLFPGWWKINIFQNGVKDPFIYMSEFLIIEAGQELYHTKDNFQNLWQIDNLAVLPLSEYYETNISISKSKEDIKTQKVNVDLVDSARRNKEEL